MPDPDPVPDPEPSAARATPRALVITVAGLGILLGLVALLILGSRLAGAGSVSSPILTSATPTAASPAALTPTPTLATGPAAAGVQSWTDLNGGECLDAFTSAWQAQYVVVDCALPHAAQLIVRAPIDASLASPYPGDAASSLP